MKQLIMAVLLGVVFCTPLALSQTSGFSQQGKVTHEMRDEGFTIAHSSLPLNSKARIVNTSTGKEIEVTITRLIPASSSRIADVSPRVWQELGLSADTDAKIYTIVSPRPQPTVAQTPAAQTPAEQAAAAQSTTAQSTAAQATAAQPTATQSTTAQTTTAQPTTTQTTPQATTQPAARTTQAEPSSSGMPAGINVENNNSFIINGNPLGGAPSAVTSDTRAPQGGGQPSVSYQQPAQPSVSYQQPSAGYYQQPAQPSASYQQPSAGYYQQPAQPSASYQQPSAGYNQQQSQPSLSYQQPSRPANDIWAQILKPAAETRRQQTQPVVTYDTRPQTGAQPSAAFNAGRLPNQPSVAFDTGLPPNQPNVNYYDARSAGVLPNVNIVNWPQMPVMPTVQMAAPSAAASTFETRPGQGQPSVRIETSPQVYQTKPVITYGTGAQEAPAAPIEKALPEIRTNMVNEIMSPASRTFVFIDASPDSPVPSVTIDNGPQTYRSVPAGEQGRDKN